MADTESQSSGQSGSVRVKDVHQRPPLGDAMAGHKVDEMEKVAEAEGLRMDDARPQDHDQYAQDGNVGGREGQDENVEGVDESAGGGSNGDERGGQSTQRYTSSSGDVARAGTSDTHDASGPQPGQSSVQADKESRFAVPASSQVDGPAQVIGDQETETPATKTDSGAARPTAPGFVSSGTSDASNREAEQVKKEMKEHPASALTLPGSTIPFALSRSAAIKEHYARLELPITGIPGTKENKEQVVPKGQVLVAKRSRTDIEHMVPRLAEFLNTFNPYINVGVLSSFGFVGWGVGAVGFHWLWIILVAIAGGMYVLKLRGKFLKKPELKHKNEEGVLSLGKGVETADWLNFILSQVWPVINPCILQPAFDQVETLAKQQAPAPIERVWISDFDLGPRAPRITSMQVYPDASGDDSILMDVTAAMHPSPQELASKKRLNTHVETKIKLGHPKVGSAEVPILVEHVGFDAKLRFHLKLMSKVPFAKTLQLTLLNTPQVEFALRPMKFGNLMNLPILPQIVDGVVSTVATQFAVSPKTITLELDKILGVPIDTAAIGVVKIVFREARGLRAADIGGKSDPYATLSLGTSHKYLARTRIIPKDLHPVWHETHYALITTDDVKNGFPLSVRVWDYDIIGKDDILGQFNMKIEEVVKTEGILFDGWKVLLGKRGEEEVGRTGKLDFQIGFFPKCESKTRRSDAERYTGGILQFNIHQASDLFLRSKDKSGLFVSPYAHVYINGTRTFRTRVKSSNPSPIFNAQTEIFLRDWKTARVRIVVKDHRTHEHDPVIGVVVVDLKEVLSGTGDMHHTAWYDLKDGIGFGRVRCSFLFQPVKLEEPEHLKGYDVGELELSGFKVKNLDLVTKNEKQPPTTFLTIRCPVTEPNKVSTKPVSEATFSPNWQDESFKIKVPYRYQSALRFEIRSKGVAHRTLALGKMFLQDLADGEERDTVLELKRYKAKDKDLGVEVSMDSTEKTAPGDVDPTPQGDNRNEAAEILKEEIVKDPSAAGSGMGTDVENLNSDNLDSDNAPQNNPDDEDNEAGWVSDTGSIESDDESDTESVTSSFSVETVAPESSSDGGPELSFKAVFRPGIAWISEQNEGEEAEIDTFAVAEALSGEHDNNDKKGDDKDKKKKDKQPSAISKFMPLGGSSSTVSNAPGTEGGARNPKDRQKLKGNTVTRTLKWGKDSLLEQAKRSKIWQKGSRKSIPKFATE
ncbi:hypothetical protein HK104_007345 [Borealophlyctis nickersoniae]|nr:hypothetical protein HK104_007345 [Borealophlyctis nickersoniae]